MYSLKPAGICNCGNLRSMAWYEHMLIISQVLLNSSGYSKTK